MIQAPKRLMALLADEKRRAMQKSLTTMLAFLLAACASHHENGLALGQSDATEVISRMGEPQMQWSEPDGSRLLAYPGGPRGVHTWMVHIDKEGKLQRVDNAMTPETFRRIEAGMSQEQVLRILGPSQAAWTVYFKARDELAWEWPYCDEWNRLARFDVLFDGTNGTVRSTLSQREPCGPMGDCWCAHTSAW